MTHKLEMGKHRIALKVSGLPLLIMVFQTLGIIYSDIGTSPLYVLNGIWSPSEDAPSREDVIGGVSAIIWTLTLLPLLKYVLIALYYGTHEGEGGTFALFQGLYPQKVFETAPINNELARDRHTRRAPEKLRWVIFVVSLFGTSLTIADGVFTAAVSVTSAVSGIAIANPGAANSITPISIAFLIVLFIAQPFGTGRLASIFAPITCCWLLLLGATGVYNIVAFPGIWRAYDPSRAIMYLVRTKDSNILSGVLLAVTGCEALFANLGQFNVLSIQLSFATFVYPSLILAYLGQGALLIQDGPNVIQNIFYLTIPALKLKMTPYRISYVFAILATLIASQAMITATFSLVQQLVNMKTLPPFRLVYTSEKVQGQVYVPAVNWTLMVVTIIFVAAFKSTEHMTDAYGFSVSTVMFITTVLIALQAHNVKQLSVVIAFTFFIFFGFLDGLFWGVSLRKVPNGAWVPLVIGLILSTLMLFWNWVKGLEERFDLISRRRLDHFIISSHVDEGLSDAAGNASTTELPEKITEHESVVQSIIPPLNVDNGSKKMLHEERRELAQIPIFAVFHKMAHDRGVPHTFTGFINQWPALPRFAVFMTTHVLPVGHVALEDRYVVGKIEALPGVYGVTYYLGYRDYVNVQIDEIVKRVCALESRTNPSDAEEVIRQLSEVASRYIHVLPYYDLRSKPITKGPLAPILNWVRTLLIEGIYYRLGAMFPENVNWLAKPDEVIYVGVSARV